MRRRNVFAVALLLMMSLLVSSNSFATERNECMKWSDLKALFTGNEKDENEHEGVSSVTTKRDWVAVEKDIEDGKPQSAIVKLDAIIKKAKQRNDFASLLLGKIKKMQCEVSIDPEVLDDRMKELESEFGNRQNGAERAVVHAMFGTVYSEMRGSYQWRYDLDKCSRIDSLRKDHLSHIFDDMEALRKAKADDYDALVVQMKDGSIYGHDMLAVMVKFAGEYNEEVHRKAAKVYADCGMHEAEAMMLLSVAKKQELYDMMMKLRDTEVGMDLAAKYMRFVDVERGSASIDEGPFSDFSRNIDSATKDEKLRFIRWARSNVKKSGAVALLDTEERQIMQPKVSVKSVDKYCFADRDTKLELEYNNVNKVLLEVRKYNGKTSSNEYRTDGALVLTRSFELGKDEVNVKRVSEQLPVRGAVETVVTLSPGRYVFVAKGLNNTSIGEIHVTSMKLMTDGVSTSKGAVYVVDAFDGRPLKGVKVHGKDKDGNVVSTELTDERGMVSFEKRKIVRVVAERSSDDVTDALYLQTLNEVWSSGYSLRGEVFTDRAIYRPGQTIKGNVLLYEKNGDDVQVMPSANVILQVKDPSRNFEKTIDLKTNEMGTADFELPLPDNVEVGAYTLMMRYWKHNKDNAETVGGHSVRVEEYKRPTFEVLFDDKNSGEQTYALGDSIVVVGKAMSFNGVPVQGGKVTCEVECAESTFWWWRKPNWKNISNVTLTTDSDGKFEVPVTLTDQHFKESDNALYRYRVKASVTDQNGETREGEWGVRISKKEYSLQISTDGSGGVVDLDKHECVRVKAINANGDSILVEGNYNLILDKDTVDAGRFSTDKPIELSSTLPFGRYELEVKAIDGKGNEVRSSMDFWTYRSSTKAIDIKSYGTRNINTEGLPLSVKKGEDFIYTPCTDVSEQKPAEIYFSPLHNDSYIYINVYAGEKLVETYTAVLSNDLHHITVPYHEEWGHGFVVQMKYVRNGDMNSMQKQFTYVRPEKQLTLTWATFRDKLQPGQNEEWVLNVKDKDGKPVNGAEMMAVMYDAALDRILRHDWAFSLTFPRYILERTNLNYSRMESVPRLGLAENINRKSFNREFDTLKEYEHNMYVKARDLRYATPVEDGAPASTMMAEESMTTSMLGGRIAGLTLDNLNEVVVEEDNEQTFDESAIRSNFAETAFFFPHLNSDAAGNVHIAFQLPESLTEWQFRAFVHTDDMNYGKKESRVVARKIFMVRPNMPRFVRRGDEASIVSSIINQSEQAVKGTVRMRLINPVSGEEVLVLKEPFSVEALQTTSVDFCFTVLENYEGMDCEIIAASGDTSDGERNFLPVLSLKTELVETVPFYLIGNEEKTLDLSALFNANSATATQRAMSVDYTATPAWMCIEALRSIALPDDDNAVSLSAAYHANSRIVEFIDKFPMLEQYEDRTSVLANAASARDRLSKLQLADGGWSWYKGMKSSYYITLSVCEQLAMIPHRTADAEKMLINGMRYLDNYELKEYNDRKKSTKKKRVMPYSSTLQYLYISALMPQRSVDNAVEKMRKDYLTSLKSHISDLTMYGVANSSLSLRAFGFVSAADDFVESLREFTVTKSGLGRFYATDAAYYAWRDYRIPTQTAAMRAMLAKNATDPYLNDMQLWLIAQKQVQKWDDPMNTIDVADLLLAISPDVTFAPAGLPQITIDGKQIDTFRTATLNTERDSLEGRKSDLLIQGNVVADISSEQVDGGVQSMTVKRNADSPSDGISWGFAQATCLENLSNVNRYATNELSVDREIYVYRNGDWHKLKKGDILTVGEKVRVRHTVKADRDMDFVRLTAQHPACFEPDEEISGYKWLGTRGGYMSIHDTHIDVSFDWFTRGSATIDTEYHVTRTGTYQVGVSTVQCVYAKQFGGHTAGHEIRVQ